MWWFTPLALLTVSLAVYVYSAAQVYSFSPVIMQRVAATATEQRTSQQTEAQQDASVQWLRLWPGESIGILPSEIPVPSDGALTAMPNAKQPDRASLSVPGGLADLLVFYRERLSADGWQEVRSWMARPVGSDDGPGNAFSVFCRAAEGPALLIAITHDPGDGRSALHLRLSGEQPGPCNAATMPLPGDNAAPRDGPSPRDRTMPPLY